MATLPTPGGDTDTWGDELNTYLLVALAADGTLRDVLSGTGSPEGAVTGTVGQLFRRTNGGTGTTLYIKESGSGNTGWVAVAAAGASGAPTTATYITQTADAGLSAEQALGALGTGVLKNTTTTGVLSIATAGTDYAPATVPGTSLPGSPTNGDEYTLTDSATAPTYEWHLRYHSTADKWYPSGGGWGFGTALPTVAAKVDRVPFTLTDSLTAPTYSWNFMYNAGEATYKWEFVGGNEKIVSVGTDQSSTSASWVNLTTTGPQFTVANAGVYSLKATCNSYHTVSNGLSSIGVAIDDGTPFITSSHQNATSIGSGTDWEPCFGTRTAAVAENLRMRYFVATAGTGNFRSRLLFVQPVRII